MAKEYVPIYECDLCGFITKKPFEVRTFNGRITDGENFEFHDGNEPLMVCVKNCLAKFLHVDDSNKPEQKAIKIRGDLEKRSETKTDGKDVLKELLEDKTEIEQIDKIDDIDEEIPVNDLGLQKPEDIFDGVVDDVIEENQKDLRPILREDQEGKYIILQKINDEIQEEQLIISLGHTSIKHFKDTIYPESLIGTYVAVMQSADEIIEKIKNIEIGFIDNVILGVPHTTKLLLSVSLDGQRAYILQEQYKNSREYNSKR
jgi:hypothetical protein